MNEVLESTYTMGDTLFPETFLQSITDPLQNDTATIQDEHPAAWQTWGIGLLIVAITAFGPSIAILGVPLLSKKVYERFMNFLVALGVGTLSGSTLYVLLPKAFGFSEDDNSYLVKSTIIIAAIYAFFGVDRALAYLLHYRKTRSARRKVHQSTLDTVLQNKNNQGTNRDNNTLSLPEPKTKVVPQITLSGENADGDVNEPDPMFEIEKNQLKSEMEVAVVSNALTRSDIPNISEPVVFNGIDLIYGKQEPSSPVSFKTVTLSPTPSIQYPYPEKAGTQPNDDIVSVCVEVVDQKVINTAELEVATVAYMIIFGSTANNFVDGMSSGAAFSDSFSQGLSIGIAVIAQQLPQEVGTLAILVKSGLGLKRTLLLALIPNSFSFVGFVVGVLLGSAGDSYEPYIFSVSSGMYLYIFLGTLLPEVRDSVNEMIKTDIRESLLATATQTTGILIGVVFMLLMSIYGKRIQI